MESLADLVSAISSFAIIFGGVVPFIPQYLVIRKQNDAEGFSTFVCFTLLIANILRIIFWFYKGYELPLLYQSGFMVMVQMVMLELCVRINSINHISSKPRLFLDFKTKDFWKWTNIDDYMYFLISFTGVVSFVTFVLYDYTFYQELLGFLSLLIEASLGLPQWYKNFQHKSTEGMSVGMVLGWTSGDFFKTGYFLVRSAPLQFVVCGVLQICVDLAIFYQIFTYPKKGKSHLLKKDHYEIIDGENSAEKDNRNLQEDGKYLSKSDNTQEIERVTGAVRCTSLLKTVSGSDVKRRSTPPQQEKQ